MAVRRIFVVQQALVCCQIAEGLVREGRIREPYLHCFGNEDAFVDFDDYQLGSGFCQVHSAVKAM